MHKRTKVGLAVMLMSAISTIALAQSFTTFINTRVRDQLDLQGTLTANGDPGAAGQVLTSNGAGDVSWEDTASPLTPANPTALLGLTAINGAASTYMRSDAAPALDQSISPTWTGTHTFTQNTTISKSDPRLCIYDFASDVTALNRISADSWRLYMVDGSVCTTTGAAQPIIVNATAGVSNSIALDSTALTWNGSAMVNIASSPTWSGRHIWTQAASGTSGIESNSALPGIWFVESDATADNTTWRMAANANLWRLTLLPDNRAATVDAITVQRSGQTVSEIALAGKTTNTFSGTGLTWAFSAESTQPGYAWNESDAAVDEKWWRAFALGGQLIWSARNDANTTSHDFMVVDRNGLTVDSIAFSASSLLASSDGTLPALGMNGTTAAWNFGGDGARDGFMSLQRYSGAVVGGPDVGLSHSRGVNTGVNTALVSNDEIGSISFMGADGTSYIKGARILGLVDGTPGTNDMPGRLLFQTTPDGSSVPTERLRISSTGAFGLSGANFGTAGQVITSNGSGSAPTWQTPVTATSGTFTATLDQACTTSPTLIFDYHKIGNVVTVYIEGGTATSATCTSDSSEFRSTGTPIPVAVRPARTAKSPIIFGFVDNGSFPSLYGCINMSSDGNVSLSKIATNGFCATSGGWTASGNKQALIAEYSFSYILDNP